MQKEASDADDDSIIRQLQANVLRTQDIASQDVSKQVGDLASMIKFNSAGRKVVNLGEVPAVTDKNIAKILDLNAASILMSARKMVEESCIARDEDCKASLEWARAQLEDPSTLPEETLTKISEGCQSLVALFEKLWSDRTSAVADIAHTVQQRLSNMLSAVPELDASVEKQQAFMAHMSGVKFNDELESIDKVVTKAKQAVTKMALATSAATIATAAEDIKRWKSFTACFAALTLLRNPGLARNGKVGEALRNQLKKTQGFIEGPHCIGFPKWLLDNVYVALGFQRSAADEGGAAAAELGEPPLPPPVGAPAQSN